jgi:C-terminal processing protease CtpA/Prc
MLNLKKIAAMFVCVIITVTILPITAGAYDYYDYLKDAADVAGEYSDGERVIELAEVITKSFPDYWESKDPIQVLYDATGMLADENDAFYKDFLAAIMYFQKEYGMNDVLLENKGLSNLENLEAQFKFTLDLTKKQDLFKAAIGKLLTEKPEYTDLLINKMMSFTDQYSHYIKATDYYGAQATQATGEVGIGVWASELGEGFIIANVINGSGADEAGLAPGDIITEINGVPYTYYNPISTRGAENTTYKATVLREDGTEETLEIKRIKYSEGGMKSERIDDTVVIGFKDFTLLSDVEDFEKYYDAAVADPTVKKLVIDLRGNVGGDQQVLEAILSVMAPEDKVLFSVITKDGKEIIRSKGRYKGAGKKFEGQLFVLTNGVTASSADILTSSIRNLGGIQVGETTYGKGIGQTGYILHNGYMAWITSMMIDVPYGGRYHGKGFVPNVKISSRETLYSKDEIIPLRDTKTPITPDTDTNRIKAFEQEVQAVSGYRLNADGVLDKRTAFLVNGILLNNGQPLLDYSNGYIIDTAAIKFIHGKAVETGMENFEIASKRDRALEYCLKYKVKAGGAAPAGDKAA